MKDFATSDDPAVQAQLDRLARLSLPQGRFGLETIRTILGRLGNPQELLPPTFHVAGTNGKGSTCTFLRFMMEEQRLTVHSATKPHLVRYNERIRVAGQLIDDALLADLLGEVLDKSEDLGPSFFEVTTAATFLAFAHIEADACVIEVGLGGRFDATNVMEHPAACGIASLGIDHEAFLLREDPAAPDHPLARIAFEKASIARRGVPLVTQSYPPEATAQIVKIARQTGATVAMRGQEWIAQADDVLHYRDGAGPLTLPLPRLPGAHQADNAALAVAMLRHQDEVAVAGDAMARGLLAARWPARLQRLAPGPLTAIVPGAECVLDGGHNPDAARVIAKELADCPVLNVVIGMLRNRRVEDFLAPLAPHIDRLWAIPIDGHDHHSPEEICQAARTLGIKVAQPCDTIGLALEDIAATLARECDDRHQTILITGSLYLAGRVLEANGEIPD
ncbi:bifunctional folylpolyglutamate synthase/dihydrofolate synthase [Croceicoccus estronivorus]|uniref:bifunctional folylpolyglutamate synthase/dihydrofolate synthase n=1 Tax=Croceicoccus estronivorus TaxID=1172626 RepID=UPI00083524AD|nr:bifunctional folylpolyglutamate synthase/dihydrofolate synthase [Croceicoccus estronivorus]OCC23062.1 bifunctional folylpolyglutamate synthase/dihydrofolate synthase [Croceicoccus estronivorus]